MRIAPDNMSETEGSSGIVKELGELAREAIIDKGALARMFNRCTTSVQRAVDRGELPAPVKIMGKPRWTAGAILDHIDARLKHETEKTTKERERLARYDP
jgi:hypothetical protein